MDGINSYTCKCVAGYRGKNCGEGNIVYTSSTCGGSLPEAIALTTKPGFEIRKRIASV